MSRRKIVALTVALAFGSGFGPPVNAAAAGGLVPGIADGLVPGAADGLVPGAADGLVPGAADGLVQQEAPIIIDTADDSVDVDDPDLKRQIEATHAGFEQGTDWVLPGPSPFALAETPSPVAGAGSGITVTFDATDTAPSNVQAVVLAAASDWNDVLATSVSGPVDVAVIWKNLGSSSLLGSAGPNGLYSGAGLPTTSFYPAALANTLLGTDVNGGSTAELTVNLNSTPNWYISSTGSPGSGQIDLYSVVLHEIGHGLGFIGSGSIHNDPGSSPTLDSPPFVFDLQVTHNGLALLDAGSPNSLLQSNNLRINVSNALDEKLYAPASWQEGSSFSHFDESSHPPGSAGALMTPSLGSQQTERELDGAIVGLMGRMGWPMKVGPAAASIGSATGTNGQITVGWSIDLNAVGPAPDTVLVEAWRNGVTLDASATTSASVGSTTVPGLLSGNSYTVKVIPQAFGQNGAAASTTVNVTGTPNAPGTISAGGIGLARTVTWSGAQGPSVIYHVERSTDGVNWSPLGSTAALSLADTVPAEGVYQYRVRSTNVYGTGPFGYSIPMGIGVGFVRPVPLDGQISRMYQASFSRPPDASGFNHWQAQRAAGVGLTTVGDTFAASAEFQATYGQLSNQQFVEQLYQNVLSRPADAGGLAYWTGLLASGDSRGQVIAGFSESSEFVAVTGTVGPQTAADAEVYRLYVAFFLRLPDAGGAQYWTGQRAAGVSLEAIAAAFSASTEFVNTYGSLPDDRFVELVYNNVLTRVPDAQGESYWMAQLTAGVDRGAMMVGFSESAEFVTSTGTLP